MGEAEAVAVGKGVAEGNADGTGGAVAVVHAVESSVAAKTAATKHNLGISGDRICC